MVEPRLVIFLGQDDGEKDRHIQVLQKKAFPPELKDLNFTVLHADEKKLSLSEITETLSCMPISGAKKRLMVIRLAHKLDRNILAGLIKRIQRPCETILVLDFPEARPQESFLLEARKSGAEIIIFKETQSFTAFDLGRAIIAARPEESLKILANLIRYKDKAEKILGALFWQWERWFNERKIQGEAYKNGLKAILEAD
ncbi:MAG TPA: hypothetical protein PLU24_04505, partial [Candidatus Omnitrophota bacterium]|nr:hypothetical protein [Candidatus Omnitrophota bacterium]